MKIVRNESNVTKFEDLNLGDVFMVDSMICMKIDEVGNANAVYLGNGSIDYFMSSHKVQIVNCELVVK